MSKPDIDFFVIGAARSGTTSLYYLLRDHPDVFLSETKEPRFFGSNWGKGWDWYSQIYADTPKGAIVGDCSPNYSNAIGEQSHVAERIHRAYPNAKIIYMIRNPIACAISNWRMTAEVNEYELPFGEALEHDDWATSVYHRVCFFRQINLYRELFEDSQILCVPLEGVRADHVFWIKKILNHIGIPSEPLHHQKTKVIGPRSLIVRAREKIDPDLRIRDFPQASISDLWRNRPVAPEITQSERAEFLRMVSRDSQNMLAYLGQPNALWPMDLSSAEWEPAVTSGSY